MKKIHEISGTPLKQQIYVIGVQEDLENDKRLELSLSKSKIQTPNYRIIKGCQSDSTQITLKGQRQRGL